MVHPEEHANVWGMRSKLEDEDMGGLLYMCLFQVCFNWDQETETPPRKERKTQSIFRYISRKIIKEYKAEIFFFFQSEFGKDWAKKKRRVNTKETRATIKQEPVQFLFPPRNLTFLVVYEFCGVSWLFGSWFLVLAHHILLTTLPKIDDYSIASFATQQKSKNPF